MNQAYITKKIEALTDSSELYYFNTLEGNLKKKRMIPAKFVVNDTKNDFYFCLKTSLIAKYHITDFKISSGNVPVEESDTGNLVSILRVRDMTKEKSGITAPGFRIIKISVKYAIDYIFPVSEVWTINAIQLDKKILFITGDFAQKVKMRLLLRI